MRHTKAILLLFLLLFFVRDAFPAPGETVNDGKKTVEMKESSAGKKPAERKNVTEDKKSGEKKKAAGEKKITVGKKADNGKKPVAGKKGGEKKKTTAGGKPSEKKMTTSEKDITGGKRTGEGKRTEDGMMADEKKGQPRQTVIPQDLLDSETMSVNLSMERLTFSRDEPVPLRFSVKNVSSSPLSFDIWEKGKAPQPDYITFQPVVFDMNGREAEIIIPYRLENRGIGDIIKEYGRRKIDLGPGEEFIQTIDMRRVYNLVPDRKYRVKGYFIPSLERGVTLSSGNIITFTRSGLSRAPERYLAGEIRHEVSPSEVVLLALDAEKRGDWNRMLKYFEVEKYIHSFSEYVKIYTYADDIERRNIVNSFIRFLSRQRDDYLLDYKVFREEYDEDRKNAFVNVLVERFGTPKNETYDYRFTLERYRSLWLIVNLEVNVMKRME